MFISLSQVIILQHWVTGSDTTICNGQNANLIKGEISSGGTNLPGSFSYQWFSSSNNTDFSPVTASGTGISFDPPALSTTTYYKRQSRSGACTVTSGTVTIRVLPLITNNNVSPSQAICYNTAPAPLTGETPAGGTGSFSYKWEESPDGVSWRSASGIFDNASGVYTAPSLIKPLKYRRIVNSGLSGCCSDTSEVIDVSIHPPLPTATIINTDTTIYSGTPVVIKLNLTGTGPWKVTWSENSVEGQSENISVNYSEISIDPEETGLDSFVYRIEKVEDANGCLAVEITGELFATIFPGFEIPEGFSPNNDGINDVFTIKGP